MGHIFGMIRAKDGGRRWRIGSWLLLVGLSACNSLCGIDDANDVPDPTGGASGGAAAQEGGAGQGGVGVGQGGAGGVMPPPAGQGGGGATGFAAIVDPSFGEQGVASVPMSGELQALSVRSVFPLPAGQIAFGGSALPASGSTAGGGTFVARVDATGASEPTLQRTVSFSDELQSFRAAEQHFDVVLRSGGGCSGGVCVVPRFTVCRVPYSGLEPACLEGADVPSTQFKNVAFLPGFAAEYDCQIASLAATSLEVQTLLNCSSKDATSFPPSALAPEALGAAEIAFAVRPAISLAGVSQSLFFALKQPGQGTIGVLKLKGDAVAVGPDPAFGAIDSPGRALAAVGAGLEPALERVIRAVALDFTNNVFITGETVTVTGEIATEGPHIPFVAKFKQDGSGLDPDFGNAGVVEGDRDGDWSCLLVDDARRLVTAGKAGGAPVVRRLTPAGEPDASFGGTGQVELPFAAQACALDAAGRVVLAGGVIDETGQGAVRVTRLRGD